MRVWRNWQTRKIQVLMIARLCRFKSCYPHQACGSPYSRKQKKCFWHFFCFLFFASPHAVPIVRTVRTRDARFHLATESLRSLQVLLPAPQRQNTALFIRKRQRRFLLFMAGFAAFRESRLSRIFLKSYRLKIHNLIHLLWHKCERICFVCPLNVMICFFFGLRLRR